jgi:hypothetical protein
MHSILWAYGAGVKGAKSSAPVRAQGVIHMVKYRPFRLILRRNVRARA